VGGIYALERIARDSPPDRATIEEVLTAYLRGHAPWPAPPAPPSLQVIATRLVAFARRQRSASQLRRAKDMAGQAQHGRPDEKVPEPQGPAADVQAAMTVLGRRKLPPGGPRPLDLARVNLQDARLLFYNLQDATLDGANLQDARLHYAKLQNARLGFAHLQGAQLDGANLQGASVIDADLQGAYLGGANLQGASLIGANLQGASLRSANLQRAWLMRANLRGANLQGARLDGARLEGAQLDGANLQNALADEDTRWPDGWDRAQAEARGVQYHD
jgi:uncharacterized protein YjbI with pentapeptide repeats